MGVYPRMTNNLNLPRQRGGREGVKKKKKKKKREGGEKYVPSVRARPRNQTQDLLHANKESVAAHYGPCFDKSAFPFIYVQMGDSAFNLWR